jgi:copper transport protein
VALRVGLVVLVVLLVLGARAPQVGAHANLERSDPSANSVSPDSPVEILLYFSEQPELRASRVAVLDPVGAQVDNSDLHEHGPTTLSVTVPELPDGTYTVTWRTVSAVDGHATAGTFAFSVGAPSASTAPIPPGFVFDPGGPPRWFSVVARWVGYLSLFVLIGMVAFPTAILRPALRRAGVRQPERHGAERLMAMFTLALLVLGALLILVMQVWTSGGAITDVFGKTLRDTLFDSRFGRTWLARAALTAFAVGGLLAFLRTPDGGRAPWSGWLVLLLGGAALALPLVVSLNSHAAANENLAGIGTAFTWAHLVVGGLWIGGLLNLVAVLPATLGKIKERKRRAVLSHAITRFSALAVGSVALLVATGILQWWLIVGSVSATLTSGYGVTLIVKVGILLPLLILGAVNLLVVRPGIATLVRERLADAGHRGGQLVTLFRRAVAAEVGLGLVILVVTGVLASGSPPYSASSVASGSSGLVQTQQAGPLDVTMSLDPGVAGTNTIDFFLQGLGEESPVREFVVRFTYLDDRFGTTEDIATGIHPTHYQLQGSQLSLAGRWQVEVVVRRDGLADARATFEIDVPPPTQAASTSAPQPSLDATPSGPTANIAAYDSLTFSPSELEVAAGTVTFRFSNEEEGVPHNFHVFRGDDADGQSIGMTELTRGPDTQTLTVDLEPGRYFFHCDVHLNMQGYVTAQ